MATGAVFKKWPIAGFFMFAFGIVGLPVGIFLCFVLLPIGLGWVVISIFFLGAGPKVMQGTWIGSCPYCGRLKVEVPKKPGAGNCPKCKQRVICHKGAFYTLKEISEIQEGRAKQ